MHTSGTPGTSFRQADSSSGSGGRGFDSHDHRSSFDRFIDTPTTAERLAQSPSHQEPRGGWPGSDPHRDELSPAAAVAGAVAGRPAMRASDEATARAAIAEHVTTVVNDGGGNRAKVGAVVVDSVTGGVFTGVNRREEVQNLHPVLESRLGNMDPSRLHPSYPGRHAEVRALNDALHARDQFYVDSGQNRRATASDLGSMTLHTAWTRSSNNGGMVEGETAHRCANCTQLTEGVHNLAGDSPRAYDSAKAAAANVEPGTPPRTPFQNDNVAGLRRGGLTGGAAALGTSTFNAFSDGTLTRAEAGRIALDTGVGIATGAAGDVVEHSVARMVDGAVGSRVQHLVDDVVGPGAPRNAGATARVVGSRMAGAGVAGAVIGAGFSSVDQVQAYRRGEVSGSQAIGTVTAEAATGAAAGLSGAAAGAAIGSIIPGAGTVVGGVIGFGVGMGVGYMADKGLRASGVTDAIAGSVTSAIDAGSQAIDSATDAIGNAGRSLASAFGW